MTLKISLLYSFRASKKITPEMFSRMHLADVCTLGKRFKQLFFNSGEREPDL